jgi:hypothetical protein
VVVGGFDEFVDQLRAGDVADAAALLAGGQTERDEQMGLAGAGIPKQHNGFAGIHVGAGGQRDELCAADSGDGVDVELGQPLDPWELRRGDAAGAAAFGAFVDLGGQHLSQEDGVGLAFADGDLGKPCRFGADGGEMQVAGCGGDRRVRGRVRHRGPGGGRGGHPLLLDSRSLVRSVVRRSS